MRQILEQTEGSIRNLEYQAEKVDHILGDINEKLHLIAQSIANLEQQGDEESAESLQSNLMEKRKEQEGVQEEITQIIGKLDGIQIELSEAQASNEESRLEIESLQKIGEDVGTANHVISQRDEIIQMQEQQCQILREKLGSTQAGDTSLYEPRARPPISERIKWVDAGILPISVHDLPPPEGINDAGNFKKISMERMTTGILRLQEMEPTIESGIGAKSDYWADYDAHNGLDYANGYQQVYDAFFGGGAIKVEFDGNKYDIINGRHRIWLAKKLDVNYLPMRVTKKVEI